MGDVTKIQWADHTASPWKVEGDELFPNVLFHDRCKMWNYHAGKANRIGTVEIEVDLFVDHERHVDAAILRGGVFGVIDECQNLLFLLLTKRPGNVPRMWPELVLPPQRFIDATMEGDSEVAKQYVKHRPNVALVASVSDQASADELIPDLLKCRDLCKYLGVSAEPLVGPVDFRKNLQYENERWFCSKCGWRGMPPDCCWRESVGCYICPKCPGFVYMGSTEFPCLDFAIIGGESGPNARPCNVEDIRSLVAQCKAAEVACFVKQLGSNIITRNDMVEDTFSDGFRGWPEPEVEHHIHGFREDYQGADCRIRLRDPKGGNPEEWPEDLRVRQLPWRAE